MKKAVIEVTQTMIREAHALIMLGYTPMLVKEALKITNHEWSRIHQSKLYHMLMISKDFRKSDLDNNMDEVTGIELTLFNCLNRFKTEKNQDLKAKIGTQIDELKQEYSQFNIYN
jgi:hypothetical protein